RKYLREHELEKYLIFGTSGSYGPGTWSWFEKEEEPLVKEYQNDKTIEEIHAILTRGGWGGNGNYIVLVRKNGAELKYASRYEPEKFKSKAFAPSDVKALTDFIAAEHVEDLPPLLTEVNDGVQAEYLHLERGGGWRVFMNNPGSCGS